MAKSQHPDGEKQPYIETQREYFDKAAGFFAKPIPEDVLKRTRQIVESAGLSPQSYVLDVATGAGALIVHFLEAGVPPANIVGVDLSLEMLNIARSRFPDVYFHRGDIADPRLPLPESFPSQIELFDVVFFNGCFGNMWDQQEALAAAARLLGGGGQIVISHPLGSRFVEALHNNEPHIVPHLLPDNAKLESLCSETGLTVDLADIQENFYLVKLRKNN
jgi:SAM-dependent methyltransferase